MATVTSVGLKAQVTAAETSRIAESVAARRFGVDADWDGDFHVTGDGDLRRSSGIQAFRQRFERALVTNPREVFWRPEWGIGIPEFLNAQATADNIYAIKSRIERYALSEPFVAGVEEIRVRMSQNQIEIEVTLMMDEGRESLRATVSA